MSAAKVHSIENELYANLVVAVESRQFEAGEQLCARLNRMTNGERAESVMRKAWQALPENLLFTDPPPRRWLLRHPTCSGAACAPGQGDGMLPLGGAATLSAEGGAGKTMLLCQLAVSIVTGRPFLGHFHVDTEARAGKVLLALAEEDMAEVHRRLFAIARALDLTDDEKRRVPERIVALPLRGRHVRLIEPVKGGGIRETAELGALRELLHEHGGDGGWSLVVGDPLARFAGGGTESDNDIATYFVELVESLCEVVGNPTVIVPHHSSKIARRLGIVDSRGVTAITDGFRWEGKLRSDKRAAYFIQGKSNYSIPMDEEIELVRGWGGTLRVPSEAERGHREDEAKRSAEIAAEEKAASKAAARRAEHAAAVDAVVATALAAGAAGFPNIDTLSSAAGLAEKAGRAAVNAALTAGRLLRIGKKTRSSIIASDHASREGD